ncbi:hypothetical protein [uncultured Ruminococcus sp.]|uniref:hypothetical protein n=1 Tax=uncultured Ruminococcus sp. TaxID=165186 RepID=UPI0015B718CE|nr:hypothetical protein [uncultured Ruminococcus sp.]
MYKSEKASSPPINNKVVDFCCGKIIMLLSDHPVKLFYQDSDSSIYILGEHLVDAEPKPITLLPEKEQQMILRHFEQRGGSCL